MGASPLLSGSLGAGPLGGSNPFAGHTPFGFQIPQGDPGAIESAAGAVRSLGRAIAGQGHAVRAAAGIAIDAEGGWKGSASAAFAGISAHVAAVCSGDAAECETAAGALQTLAQELAHAQSVTRQALADCTRLEGEVRRQQGIAQTAGQQAESASASARTSATVHPAAAAAMAHQAQMAGQTARDAVTAAAAAGRELEAATRRGQQAWEAYQRVAGQASGRLMSAAGGMRQAPEIAGGAPIPVTASASDVSLAAAMMSGAGAVPTSAAALANPAALRGLACGPVTPGAAVAFLQQFDERQQVERIAASDKPLDGSVWGVVPGGGQAKQFADGAWSTTKGTFEFVTNPDQWKQAVDGALQSSPLYRQVFDHEDPITAQMRATQTSDGIVKGMVDWQDFSHGRIARGLGAVTAGALEAKGLGHAIPKIAGAVRTDPSWGAGMGMKTLGAAGVPHAGDLTDIASQVANPDVRRMLDTYAHTYAASARGRVLRSAATVGASYTLARALNDPAVLQRMSETPVHPQVIVVAHPPLGRVPHPSIQKP